MSQAREVFVFPRFRKPRSPLTTSNRLKTAIVTVTAGNSTACLVQLLVFLEDKAQFSQPRNSRDTPAQGRPEPEALNPKQAQRRGCCRQKLHPIDTHRLLSGSFLWFIFRNLFGNPKKELLRSLWINPEALITFEPESRNPASRNRRKPQAPNLKP